MVIGLVKRQGLDAGRWRPARSSERGQYGMPGAGGAAGRAPTRRPQADESGARSATLVFCFLIFLGIGSDEKRARIRYTLRFHLPSTPDTYGNWPSPRALSSPSSRTWVPADRTSSAWTRPRA